MDYLTVSQVAERLQVDPETVRRWLRSGELRGSVLGDRAGWRVSSDELRRFMEARQPVPLDPAAALPHPRDERGEARESMPASATKPVAHPLKGSARLEGTMRAERSSRRETFLDWWPGAPDPDADSPDLVTKDELLARLRAAGVRVTDTDLLNWQKKAVIPYGIKRWRRGGTYTLYPASLMVPLLTELRSAQEEGRALGDIAAWLRYEVAPSLAESPPGSATISAGTASAYATAHPATISAGTADGAALPDALREQLVAWARSVERQYGTTVSRVGVELVDGHGRALPGIVVSLT